MVFVRQEEGELHSCAHLQHEVCGLLRTPKNVPSLLRVVGGHALAKLLQCYVGIDALLYVGLELRNLARSSSLSAPENVLSQPTFVKVSRQMMIAVMMYDEG